MEQPAEAKAPPVVHVHYHYHFHRRRNVRPQPQQQPTSPYLNAQEAASYLGVTLKAMYGYVERGRLKPLPGTRRYRFTRDQLDEFLRGRNR
jgi:excisionase family DNA binding protein